MTVPFASVVTPDSLVFTAPDGKTHSVVSSHAAFGEVKSLIKQIQALRANDPDGEDVVLLIEKLVDLVTPVKLLTKHGQGEVEVRDGVVFYRGETLHSTLTKRILWGLSEGFDMNPSLSFLSNLMENPSKRAVDELYSFIEKHRMGITEDGHILAYKRVRGDFRDIYSGKFDNSPGKIVEEPRNRVDDDPTRTCSNGLHFCSQSYLPHYGAAPGNRIVVVKVNPRDVVSVPVDYDAAKVRCCRYEVLSEYQGTDKDDLLAAKPVFETSEFTGSGDGYDDCEFGVGDEVLVVDTSGLGQTDVIYDEVYVVDNVQHNGESGEWEIFIGPSQGIGRWYGEWRFDHPYNDTDDTDGKDDEDTDKDDGCCGCGDCYRDEDDAEGE